ncbi:P-loop containing nucleoside triphosphate hydrolase protein [Phakopsora pachyrhizi]|nr:P-loop containing nucleoside triphosphate hydrolase protein [Phakopsora pachyrhizi]
MYRLLSGLYAHLTRKEEFNVILLGLDNAGKTASSPLLFKTIYNPSNPGLKPSQISSTIGQNIGKITLSSAYLQFLDLGGSLEIRPIWEKYYDDADAICWIIDSKDRVRNGWFSGENHTKISISCDDSSKGKGKSTVKDSKQSAQPVPGEGWLELEKVLRHSSISHSNIPVLVICNKQDQVSNCRTSSDERTRKAGSSQDEISDSIPRIEIQEDGVTQDPMTVEEIRAMFNRLVVESERSEKARSLGLSEAHVLGVSSLNGEGIQDAINWLFYRVAVKGQSKKTKQQYQKLQSQSNIPSAETIQATTSGSSSSNLPIRLADLVLNANVV